MKDVKSPASKNMTPGKGGLNAEIQSRIGHQLRAMYDDVVRQGVPERFAQLEFEEFRVALDKLPQDQREALILVGASGFSYEDAAAICGCAVGTIKSRVNRARSKLAALLYVEGAEDFGPDETVRAVIGGNG